MFNAVLAVVVIINGFTNGLRCGSATEVTGDVFPGVNREPVIIARIYSVVDAAGSDVAWVYQSQSGSRVTEASQLLKSQDAKAFGLPVDASNRSGLLAPYRALNLNRLKIKLCADGEARRK